MNINELTDKLYAEGVEKGNAEAQAIIAKAHEEGDKMVAAARKQAEEIVAEAEKKAGELDKNTRVELRMYAEQSVNALKTEIANMLCGQVVDASVKAAAADAKFMQGIIARLAEQMAKEGSVVIEAQDAETLRKYFAANAKNLLDKGVEIREVKGLKTAFAIAPKDGGYKINFGEAELVAYFKEFLRPQLIELLF